MTAAKVVKFSLAFVVLFWAQTRTAGEEDRQLYLKWIKRDITATLPFVSTGSFVRVQVQGWITPLPSDYYYFRSEDDPKPIALYGSISGVSTAIAAQFPRGITAEFGSTWLLKVLVAWLVGDRAELMDSVALKSMNQAGMDAQLTAEARDFYRTAAPPEFKITGDRWSARFYSVEQDAGIKQHEFSGTIGPFSIKKHTVSQLAFTKE